MAQDDRALHFASQIFDLLDRASTTSTYKYAVLLGILECCQRHVQRDGSVPDFVTTRQLAESVIHLYWPQTKPFAHVGQVLTQNRGSQARILSVIEGLRRRHSGVSSPHAARILAPKDFEKTVRDVEWTLVLMPLPKLQRLGGNTYEFLYSICWGDDIRKTSSGFSDYQRGRASDFDNRILLKPGVGEFFVRLGPLLRPLIQREWARTVAGFNDLPIAALESFLFDPQRQNLATLVEPLAHAQEGRCFYCRGRLTHRLEVDHFVPWSRAPNDEVHNLVLAHAACNNNKSNHLADIRHLRAWLSRNTEESVEGVRFRDAVTGVKLQLAREQTISIARAVYFGLPDDMLLWNAIDTFTTVEPAVLRATLG